MHGHAGSGMRCGGCGGYRDRASGGHGLGGYPVTIEAHNRFFGPAERLIPALNFARIAPPLGAGWRIRGLRLAATDFDWTAGRGLEVRGPGEALLLCIAGRRGVAEELQGPGREILRQRIGG